MDKATLINSVKNILPERFLTKYEAQDMKLGAYVDLCLADINYVTPLTSYTVETMPSYWDQLIIFGANVYATLFIQAGYTLKDFSFSDAGLSLNPERTQKLDSLHEKMYKMYMKNVWNVKKKEILKIKPKGVGSWTNIVGAISVSPMYGIVSSLYGNNAMSPNTYFPGLK